MKGIIKKVLIITWILFLATTLAKPLIAGTTISGAVSCRVPYILKMSDGTIIVTEEAPIEQNANIDENKKDSDTFTAKQESNFITQKEENITEDNEVELINTVYAK